MKHDSGWVLLILACAAALLPAPPRAAAATKLPEVFRPTLAGGTVRPLHYRPDSGDFITENGREFFNRSIYSFEGASAAAQSDSADLPLWARNEAFRFDAGDRPEFSLYLPGRGGNLRLGLKTASETKWLFDARKVIARYRPGSMLYEIQDPLLGTATLRLAALPMASADGLLARVELDGQPPPAVELVWAFGGLNGDKGARAGDIGCEREPVSRFFQLKPEYCKDNKITFAADLFELTGKSATIFGIMPPGAQLAFGDARQWDSAQALLTPADAAVGLPVATGRAALAPGKPLYLALQCVANNKGNQGKPLAPSFKSAQLPALFDQTERYRQSIAGRIAIDTPDPYLNAAVPALCIAADGVWDETQGTVMHGAVAWRSKLLGWRGPYSTDALGWHDRAERHLAYWAGQQNTGPVPDKILPADPTVNLARNEPSLHTSGDMDKSHYDMNLVYIDALFRHLLWTGDLKFAARVWPVIERHLAWERRLFRRPFGEGGQAPLYEAYAAIWASDDLQYNGAGVTHTTAYNYYHNKMAARLARLLGHDPAPYEREAGLIRKAMRQELWLPDRGWYAEYKDLLGLRRTHPSAGLWTVYHTIDSEAADPLEAWQLTHSVDTQIAHIPIHGAGVPEGGFYTLPTTNWMPYSWSVNNVVMAESGHTALAFWQAGRADEALKLFKGCLLDSMYQGLCPGNLGMTTTFDMARGECQRDFADAVGVISRGFVEGLFGVTPDALAGRLTIRPGYPAEWDHARLKHPDLTFDFARDALTDRYTVEQRFAKPLVLCLVLAARRDGIASVTVNGKESSWRTVADSVGTPRIEVAAPAASRHEISITWQGRTPETALVPSVAARGTEIGSAFATATVLRVADPQHALDALTTGTGGFDARAGGVPGPHTAFVQLRQNALTWWAPLEFEVRPDYEIVESPVQEAGRLKFRLRNNTPVPLRAGSRLVHAGGGTVNLPLDAPAFGESPELSVSAAGGLPGANPVRIELGQGRKPVDGSVTNWKLQAEEGRTRWEPLELAALFNDSVTRIFQNEYLSPRSPYCSLAIPKQGIGSWCSPTATFKVNDAGLRQLASRNQDRFILPQGVPFATPGAVGVKNIAFTSQWDNYPKSLSFLLSGRASHLYLLLAGSTNSMQCRIDNGEVIVTYADGTAERLALENPTTWWPIDQDYFIDDFGFQRPGPIPPRVNLQTGDVRLLDPVSARGHGGKVAGGAANVLDLPLDAAKELKSLTLHTLSGEVVIGLMAATLARQGQ